MIFILLAISLSVSLLVIFKLFQKYKVDSFHAITINYLSATLTGIYFSNYTIDITNIIQLNWIWICFPLGFLFISVFVLISLTTQKINLATASVANKMSVIIPVLSAVVFVGDTLSIIKTCGIVLALLAVYLTVFTKTENKSYKNLWLPLLVFLGSGLIDSGINLSNHYFLKQTQDNDTFTIAIFFFAFIIGSIVLVFQYLLFNKTIALKSVVAGLILGVPNYFSIYFIIKSLNTSVLSSAQLFPVLNISNVILSAIIGYFIFKEKLSRINIIGILLATISLVLITSK